MSSPHSSERRKPMIGVLLTTAALSLTSPAFTDGGAIPSKYTCDAGQQNPSPALAWKDAPANAKSFVLILHDPDAPMAGGFTHWVLFDIPASTKELPENFQPGSVGMSGNSGFRRAGYGGPCPPTGSHHYHYMWSAARSWLGPINARPSSLPPTNAARG